MDELEKLKSACSYLENSIMFMIGRMVGESHREGAQLDFHKWRKVAKQVVGNAERIARGEPPLEIQWAVNIDDILGRA